MAGIDIAYHSPWVVTAPGEVFAVNRTALGSTLLLGLVLAAAVPRPSAPAELPFKVIVHPDVLTARVDRATLSALFLKRSVRWSDGLPAQPVDQSARAPVREAFSQAVHGQPVAAVLRFWSRQISEGRGVPPPVKQTDAEVVEHVASKRGGVGYVAPGAHLPGTVRVLVVD